MTTNLRSRIVIGGVAVLALVGAFLLLNRSESAASRQSTDDAYVRADFTVIVPQVSGIITEVAVEDNQEIEAGAPLLRIDERELAIAVANAQAHVVAAQAAIDSLEAQIERQRSLIQQARAAIAAAEANLKLAGAERRRFANLARDGSGTLQAQQQAEAQWAIQRAARERDLASLQSTEQQTAVLLAELEGARGGLLAAQAEKAAAQLDLSRARLVAPVGGVVAQRRARVGGYARAGEPLLTLVPLDKVYIEANFRETQLTRVQVGQPVEILVDALPGVRLKGHVESLGAASGASFSTVPPHNATGNFTKIVQRLPVRIQVDAGQEQARRLRVGMSVRPSIDVDARGSQALQYPADTPRATL
ncbi:HlyD family secretion protein [Stutzerimonas kirkiae]|uniref:Efflux transporter periplasmic adaptor subunit n=1 Tax=Stutzerimonas kirkiae TaxID=2211392 RepID=A0A4Q9R945_9GAMM|nr:HlyD family secretion protein [Stutzerimonas kirkiae]TBU96252.1 efflux transporter periplasmic adaptor subunit [Stutzerimonas kirkiae]TBV03425.1 efflux transporter periplasmic adaptor subunit [Stutzerimonas kirkiae]TBV05880.1 efflux transporter periplasmic adaptor subunit [Stutzerimonas kirkiae]TBV12947.1 efflux transporter periplasmic adaptor subunit [Stutzerimonas kirkiae]